MKWTEEDVARHQARMAALKEPDAPETFREKLERLREQGFKARAEERAKRPKPSRNTPNKTERRFEQEILGRIFPPGTTFGFQSLTFRLAPDLRYTPDWVVWRESDMTTVEGLLTCYEVKGAHIWEDARVKFLTSREFFPWVQFEAWQWKGGEWREIWTA